MTSVEEFFSRADLLSCVAVNLGSGKELAVCRLVNRAWYAALKSDHIWKEVYQRQLARPDEQEDMGWYEGQWQRHEGIRKPGEPTTLQDLAAVSMAFDPHTTTLVVARVPTPLPQQQHQQQTNCLTLSALSMQHSSRATSGQVTLPSLRHVADVDDGLPSARSLLPLPMAAGCGIVLVQQRAGSWPVCAWSLTPSSSSPSSQAAQAGSHSGCSLVVDTAQDTSVQGADCESVCGAVVPHAGTSPAGVSPSAGVLLGVLPGTIPDVHVLALAIGPCTAVKHTSTPSRQGLSTHQPGTAGRESDTRSQPQFHGTATAVALHANHHVCIWELNLGSVLRSTLLACVDTAPAPAALLTPIGRLPLAQLALDASAGYVAVAQGVSSLHVLATHGSAAGSVLAQPACANISSVIMHRGHLLVSSRLDSAATRVEGPGSGSNCGSSTGNRRLSHRAGHPSAQRAGGSNSQAAASSGLPPGSMILKNWTLLRAWRVGDWGSYVSTAALSHAARDAPLQRRGMDAVQPVFCATEDLLLFSTLADKLGWDSHNVGSQQASSTTPGKAANRTKSTGSSSSSSGLMSLQLPQIVLTNAHAEVVGLWSCPVQAAVAAAEAAVLEAVDTCRELMASGAFLERPVGPDGPGAAPYDSAGAPATIQAVSSGGVAGADVGAGEAVNHGPVHCTHVKPTSAVQEQATGVLKAGADGTEYDRHSAEVCAFVEEHVLPHIQSHYRYVLHERLPQIADSVMLGSGSAASTNELERSLHSALAKEGSKWIQPFQASTLLMTGASASARGAGHKALASVPQSPHVDILEHLQACISPHVHRPLRRVAAAAVGTLGASQSIRFLQLPIQLGALDNEDAYPGQGADACATSADTFSGQAGALVSLALAPPPAAAGVGAGAAGRCTASTTRFMEVDCEPDYESLTAVKDLYSEALMLTPIPTHLALLTVRGDVQLYPILKNQRSRSM